jgi:hypothetical protein
LIFSPAAAEPAIESSIATASPNKKLIAKDYFEAEYWIR